MISARKLSVDEKKIILNLTQENKSKSEIWRIKQEPECDLS